LNKNKGRSLIREGSHYKAERATSKVALAYLEKQRPLGSKAIDVVAIHMREEAEIELVKTP
jgi:hypothetical protein